jgi:NAD(P)-dependent dehydrogenase (short-subunit alcohol dehydrogenase family)
MSDVNGKRVIVTGGASGMGEAVVRDLCRHGAQVISLDVNADDGQRVATEAGAHFLRCDITSASSVEDSVAAAAAQLGGLDALVHAAGTAPGAPAEQIALAQWEEVFAVNARGTFLINQAVFPLLKDQGGRIINFASSAGLMGYPGKAAYAAAKGAVLAWIRSIAHEWGRYRITVNAVAPAISTPMYAKTRSLMSPEQLDEHEKMLARDLPLGGQLGDPVRDLAPVIRFLVSDDSGFITGQTIAVDGGILKVR